MLLTVGKWSAEMRSENTNDILDKYLRKAVAQFERVPSCPPQKRSEALITLAKFCYSQYKQISEYMKSPVFQEKQDLMRKLRAESDKM